MVAIRPAQTATATRQPRFKIHAAWKVLVTLFWVAIVIGIIGSYFLHWSWTGFKANGTLWDWLQLLSAPVFVSVLPLIFTGHLRSQESSATSDQQDQSHVQSADDQKQEGALREYQNQMVDLLLNKNLSRSQPGSEVREVAKALTLAVLRHLGTNRKGDLLQFLYDAGLIYRGKAIVDIHNADLGGTDLSGARLNGIDLSGVDLSGATLNRANLSGGDLSSARLAGTDLTGANLSGVNLTGADLSNAILNGTNLREATYTNEQLSRSYQQR